MQTTSKPAEAKQVFALNKINFQEAPKPYEGKLKKKTVVKLRVMRGTKFIETIHVRITHTDGNESTGYVLSGTWCPAKHGITQGSAITFKTCQVWVAWDNVSIHGKNYFLTETAK